jgi:GH15 family glucan-1,4-alpha-glucosidase
MYKPISDYGVIGNGHSVALVGKDGSIDWCCLPDLDSPSLFAAILDDRRGGRFRIAPQGGFSSRQSYLGETNVLQTTFRTGSGLLTLTDFMPPASAGVPQDIPEDRLHAVYRRAEVQGGQMDIEVEFGPRFDYARCATELTAAPFGVVARGGKEGCTLLGPGKFALDDSGSAVATLALKEGQPVWFELRYGGPGERAPAGDPEGRLEAALDYWRGWLASCERGQAVDFGRLKGMVNRSSLCLKLLTFEPTGAIAAAATMSLPEWIGGERNWDYRYCWLRDASLTVRALWAAGHLSELKRYVGWVRGECGRRSAAELQIVYGLRGETELHEQVLPHLTGYRGSRPVRVGNGAWDQRQMDVYGEVLDAGLLLTDYVGRPDEALWEFMRDICDHVCRTWQRPDRSIWEVRSGNGQFVYSKFSSWLTLHCGVVIAEQFGLSADLGYWTRNRDMIHEEILRQGWSEARRSFVQQYGGEALDASLLRLAASDFLPPEDPRLAATIEAMRAGLGQDGFLYRYQTEDGLTGGEGCFLVLGFWLAEALIVQGRLEEAERVIEDTLRAANPLGLFSEEFDPATDELLGNYPQAFTHIGLINACFSLAEAKRARAVQT